MFLFKYFRCIKRIIFNSIVKPTVNEKGEKEIDSITTSQALQIAGRAGRYGSSFKQGEVTTMHREDLAQLKEILGEPVPPVKVRAPACTSCSGDGTMFSSQIAFPRVCLQVSNKNVLGHTGATLNICPMCRLAIFHLC